MSDPFEVIGRDIYLAPSDETGKGLPVFHCSTHPIATHLCAVLNGASGLAVEFIHEEHLAREAGWQPPVRGMAQGDTNA